MPEQLTLPPPYMKAFEIADEFDSKVCAPEHALVALLRDASPHLSEILASVGVSVDALESVTHAIIRRLNRSVNRHLDEDPSLLGDGIHSGAPLQRAIGRAEAFSLLSESGTLDQPAQLASILLDLSLQDSLEQQANRDGVNFDCDLLLQALRRSILQMDSSSP